MADSPKEAQTDPDLWASPVPPKAPTRCTACFHIPATFTIHVRDFAFNLCDDCRHGLRTILRMAAEEGDGE